MNVVDRLKNEDWIDILREQPQLADKCNKWRKFNGGDWSCLLYKQPQFADKCDWEKLTRRALIWLLQKHPEFADKLLHISVSDGSNAK